MRGRTVALAVAAALTLMGGCGPEDAPPPPDDQEQQQPETDEARSQLTPEQLLNEASANTWNAASKRIEGMVTVADNEKTFDYVMVGSLAKGTQIETAPEGTSVVEVIRIGDDVYIKAGEPFWQWYVSLAHRQFVVDTWVLARFEDYPSLVPVSSTVPTPRTEVTAAGTDTVAGTPVVVLEDTDGNRYYVDDYGEPYLLRFEGTQDTPIGMATAVVEFSQIGEVSDVIAAPSGEIVDLNNLPTEAVGHD